MLATAKSIALLGMDGHPVDVEVSITSGLPAFNIVGLPDPSIQEARERVRSAIQSCKEQWPQQRVTVNLSPAHLRKAGSSFDLAMALAVLAAQGRLEGAPLHRICVLGELSLDGGVRRVRGVLPAAMAAMERGTETLMVPASNAAEAAAVRGARVLPVTHLAEAVRFLRGEGALDPFDDAARARDHIALPLDFSDVRGNRATKRALEIAAAGGHNVLMIGAPGGGKTMLARRLPTILPAMSDQESFEVTRIYSVAGLLPDGASLIRTRPFRAPHHTGSTTGLIGGGSGMPHPGEASLAHRGILFLDEFGEFRRETLQALRQPLEDGVITIVRSKWAVTYPARFQLVAASNPCPCGFTGDDQVPCTCQDGRKLAYQERLSGPVMDRIDIQVGVDRLTKDELFRAPVGEPSEQIAARVATAWLRQRGRCDSIGVGCNAELPARALEEVCMLTPAAKRTVEAIMDGLHLTARGAHRMIRVARTIADLNGQDQVDEDAIDEAAAHRLTSIRVSAP